MSTPRMSSLRSRPTRPVVPLAFPGRRRGTLAAGLLLAGALALAAAPAAASCPLLDCPDEDGDCVCDGQDNCPRTPNPPDLDGFQSDKDTDGFGDVCDCHPDLHE